MLKSYIKEEEIGDEVMEFEGQDLEEEMMGGKE